jgi:hypothetical protein
MEARELVVEVLGRLQPPLRVFLEAGAQDPVEVLREVRLAPEQRGWIVAEDRGDDIDRGIPAERVLPGDHLVEQEPE